MIYAIVILIFLSTWALMFALLLKVFNNEKPINKIKYYDESHSKIEEQNSEKESNKKRSVSLKLPKIFLSIKKKKELKLFDEQLTEGISIISNSLKAGYSFLQSMSVVMEETKDPFAKEFKTLFKEMSLGISEEEALGNLMNRVESEDLRLMVNAILIQKDIGGNLSEILDNIAETVRERQKIKNEIKTLTAQGRLSGWIVAMLPVFLGSFIFIFNREYMILLFTTPIGLAMVFAAFISQCFGFLMIRKIINIEM